MALLAKSNGLEAQTELHLLRRRRRSGDGTGRGTTAAISGLSEFRFPGTGWSHPHHSRHFQGARRRYRCAEPDRSRVSRRHRATGAALSAQFGMSEEAVRHGSIVSRRCMAQKPGRQRLGVQNWEDAYLSGDDFEKAEEVTKLRPRRSKTSAWTKDLRPEAMNMVERP